MHFRLHRSGGDVVEIEIPETTCTLQKRCDAVFSSLEDKDTRFPGLLLQQLGEDDGKEELTTDLGQT